MRFIWKSLVCRFRVPHAIVTNDNKQFDNEHYRRFCVELNIECRFSSSMYPQANGQVKAVNKIIKCNLETKLGNLKGAWVDELPNMLWAYRTTSRNATSETPFSLTFGTKAVILVEIRLPSLRRTTFEERDNDNKLRAKLDLLEEKRNDVALKITAYQQRVACYYNSTVKE